MKQKSVAQTYTMKSELVLPNDTNTLGNLMGGKLMHWVDVIAAISAQKATNRTVVTAAVDSLTFQAPIRLGELVELEACVTRSFHSSMEVRVEVHSENLMTGDRRKSNTAFLTFVAVDQSGNSIPVPEIVPHTGTEKRWHKEALKRRELRLMLSGRKAVTDPEKLLSLFNNN
ncbi:MAG: acyl-CoA thioesterase [Bacteroidota bacterium]